MPLEQWSEGVTLVHLADDPQFTDDFESLDAQVEPSDVVLDFGGVSVINSSNISRLLKLRKRLVTHDRRMVLCNLNTQVWGALLVTGLDKIFELSDNVPIALTTVQLAR